MQQPIATWNTARGVWEKPGTENLFCEHWELFSATWPTSGITLNGQVFELPTPAHHITDSESSLSPTLPTPKARDAQAEGYEAGLRRATPQVGTIVKGLVDGDPRVLPTPTAVEGTKSMTYKNVDEKKGQTNLTNVVNTAAGVNAGNKGYLGSTDVHWGKFEPAIRRWEEVLGRPAPAPTKPDGKDGAHRLSSAFTEFMMGLEPGWITDCGLTRNEELKACGNGVVPQQAELALRILLEGVEFQSKRGGGLTVLPTPTVMDQRDGKHFRSVAIKDLANGNNRGLNLNNIVEAGLTDWNEGDKFEIVDGKAVKK